MNDEAEIRPASDIRPGSEATSVHEVARLLSAASDVTLLAHINPDADALGSALAIGMVLHRRGATVRVSFGEPERPPVSLRDLDPDHLVVPAAEVPAVPPVLVVLDTGSLDRLGGLADRVLATEAEGGPVVVLDHHVGNTRYGTHHVIDEQAEATVVLALDLLDELRAVVDEPIARCLYAGLATDTGSFRRARASTHHIAARLLDAGVDPDATIGLFNSHPFSWMTMLSSVLGAASLEPGSARGLGIVYATVPLAVGEGARTEEIDSVIDILRTTHEAEVTAVLKEIAPARWSVSLRADSRIDVGEAASKCGGGGHRLASGFTAEGTAEELVAGLRRALDDASLLR